MEETKNKKWIASRYFTASFSYDERLNLIEEFGGDEWKKAKLYLNETKNKISPNALALSRKIQEQLGFDVFPLIVVTAVKGWMSSGCATFMMIRKDGSQLLFDNKVYKYLLKKSKLEYYIQTFIYDAWVIIKDN